MKSFLFSAAVCLMLCQCETVPGPSDARPSLTDSGLSPSERERSERDRPLSADPTDPLNKVRSGDGAFGVNVMEF